MQNDAYLETHQMNGGLTLVQVRDRYDVAIIGAGPAGSAISRQLALAGLAVLLVDKASFPRPKVCGCCLSISALSHLRALGLDDIPGTLAAVPLKRLLVAAGPGGRLSLPLQTSVSISRSALDAAMVAKAMEAEVQFCDETTACIAAADGDQGRIVELHSKEIRKSIRASIVVVADGLGGAAAAKLPALAPVVAEHSHVGTGAISHCALPFYEAGTIYMAYGEGSYLGLVRLEDGSTDLAAALDPNLLRSAGSPSAAATALIEMSGWPVPRDLHEISWKGTVALTRRRKNVAENRLFVIGDAASYVEPFTGEGIAWALESAIKLAPLVVRGARRWDASLIWHWQHIYRRTVVRRQRPTRYVAAILHNAPAAIVAANLLNAVPALIRPLVSAVHGDTTREGNHACHH